MARQMVVRIPNDGGRNPGGKPGPRPEMFAKGRTGDTAYHNVRVVVAPRVYPLFGCGLGGTGVTVDGRDPVAEVIRRRAQRNPTVLPLPHRPGSGAGPATQEWSNMFGRRARRTSRMARHSPSASG